MSSDAEKTAATTPEPVSGVRAASAWDAHISEDFKRVLRSTVSEETYRAARGPPELDRSNRTFTAVQMCLALVHVAGLLGVASLYPQQITCLLTLFTGRHVFCIMQTGFGKTFAYEGLVLLYDYLFNGYPAPTYKARRQFCPVLIVINPLSSLMIEQTKAFNVMVENKHLPIRAAQLSGEQSDTKITTLVKNSAKSVAIVHSSVETMVSTSKPYRNNISQ